MKANRIIDVGWVIVVILGYLGWRATPVTYLGSWPEPMLYYTIYNIILIAWIVISFSIRLRGQK